MTVSRRSRYAVFLAWVSSHTGESVAGILVAPRDRTMSPAGPSTRTGALNGAGTALAVGLVLEDRLPCRRRRRRRHARRAVADRVAAPSIRRVGRGASRRAGRRPRLAASRRAVGRSAARSVPQLDGIPRRRRVRRSTRRRGGRAFGTEPRGETRSPRKCSEKPMAPNRRVRLSSFGRRRRLRSAGHGGTSQRRDRRSGREARRRAERLRSIEVLGS